MKAAASHRINHEPCCTKIYLAMSDPLLLSIDTVEGCVQSLSDLAENVGSKDKRISLIHLLSHMRSSQSMDLQGKGYTIMGLIELSPKDFIAPSYEKVPETVYPEIVLYQMTVSKAKSPSARVSRLSGFVYDVVVAQLVVRPNWEGQLPQIQAWVKSVLEKDSRITF